MNRNWRIALLAFVVLVVTPVLVVLAGPDEGTFSSSINSTRQSNGLNTLQAHSTLTAYARTHSEEMAGTNSIYHSQSSELTGLVSGWLRIGENVGRGPTASAIYSAFMNSPGHRDNILGDYTHMGVGTFQAPDGLLYVTTIFMKLPPPTTTTTTTPTTTATTTTPTSTTASTTTTTTTTTSTLPVSSTTTSTTSTSTTPVETTSTSTPGLTAGEALGCALSAIATGTGEASGVATASVVNCDEAAALAAAWPAGTTVTAEPGSGGAVVLTFTSPSTSTVVTTTVAEPEGGVTTPTTEPAIDFTEPAAPGAAATVRRVASAVLGAMALLAFFAWFRRRR